jgi:hypothetical protein
MGLLDCEHYKHLTRIYRHGNRAIFLDRLNDMTFVIVYRIKTHQEVYDQLIPS